MTIYRQRLGFDGYSYHRAGIVDHDSIVFEFNAAVSHSRSCSSIGSSQKRWKLEVFVSVLVDIEDTVGDKWPPAIEEERTR